MCKLTKLSYQAAYLFSHDSSHSFNLPVLDQTQNDLSQVRSSPMVAQLNISLNELTELSINDLSSFPHLRSLDASLNMLSTFPGISECPKLTILCLAFNKIKTWPESLLEGTRVLQNLDLRSNYIKQLPIFPSLPHL
uniref:Uncharacterized protein n=1 Tax=Ciona savignyi TaxID=51511 RepID=H2YSB5_CIOSA